MVACHVGQLGFPGMILLSWKGHVAPTFLVLRFSKRASASEPCRSGMMSWGEGDFSVDLSLPGPPKVCKIMTFWALGQFSYVLLQPRCKRYYGSPRAHLLSVAGFGFETPHVLSSCALGSQNPQLWAHVKTNGYMSSITIVRIATKDGHMFFV